MLCDVIADGDASRAWMKSWQGWPRPTAGRASNCRPATSIPKAAGPRLSYTRAEALFEAASGDATLHQLRHSALTHDAEDGTSTPMLRTRSGHTSFPDVLAALTQPAAPPPPRHNHPTRESAYRMTSTLSRSGTSSPITGIPGSSPATSSPPDVCASATSSRSSAWPRVRRRISGSTSSAVVMPANGTIAITYLVAPMWSWTELVGTAPSPSTAQVAASAPPGGQVGPIPQVTFPAGTAIYADSAAIAAGTQGSGAQQLYQAIGSGNLAAFRDGTDAVGHATLGN
jgi:hypothetical protein